MFRKKLDTYTIKEFLHHIQKSMPKFSIKIFLTYFFIFQTNVKLLAVSMNQGLSSM